MSAATVGHRHAQNQQRPVPPRRGRSVDAARREFLRRQLRIPADRGIAGLDYPSWQPRTINACVAPEARARCERERRDDWLPRYQRGSVIRHDTTAAEQAYRRQRCQQWISRTHWLQTVLPWALERHQDVLRRHNHLSPATFTRVLATLSLYADRRTGRDLIARPQVLAAAAEVSERTVQYVLAAAVELGLMARLVPGRMLTWTERCQARDGGSRQRGLSTVWAFSMPRTYLRVLKLCTPPRGTQFPQQTSDCTPDNNRFATVTKPAPPAPQQKRGPAKGPRRRPRGLPLAAELTTAVDWLRDVRPGRIATATTRYAIALHPWSAAQLVEAMTAINRRLGYKAPERVKASPYGLLHWYLAQIDPYADHPKTVEMLERQERRAAAARDKEARARERAEDAAARASAAAPTAVARHARAARAALRRSEDAQ